MKIGTDVSLKVCRQEGYMMCEFKVKELFPKGRSEGIDKDYCLRFFKHYPKYILEQMYGEKGPLLGTKTIYFDELLSTNDLWEKYLENSEIIDCTVGVEHGERKFPVDEYDILILADDIDVYCGLK